VAESSRISAGRARDWIRAAVVIADPVGPRGHDLPGRDPDPDLHRLRTVAQVMERRPDREGGEGRPDCVVVVGPWPAEDREDRISDELLARPAEPFDGIGHDGQRRSDAAPHDLGIVLSDHPDVVDEVGEEGRDDASVAIVVSDGRDRRQGPGRGERRPALIAEPRPGSPGRAARIASHRRADPSLLALRRAV
jgi:hypothetical protein